VARVVCAISLPSRRIPLYSVCILYSRAADRYYVRSTEDVGARVAGHNRPDGPVTSTRKNGPRELVSREDGCTTRGDAVFREKQIKRWKCRRKIGELVTCSVGRVPT
jgi:putative endonuclease